MIAKMKVKFIPRDYQINLFRRMQNLRQKLMTVKEYTEEFYRLNIRAGHRESDDEKVARYLNGLRYDIQDELSMTTIRTIEDAYQMALKAEEKLSRKQGQRGRGRSQPRGKAVAQEKYQKPKEERKKPLGKVERGGTSQRGQQYAEQRGQHNEQRGDCADANTFPRTRGRGRGRGESSHVSHVERMDIKQLTVQTGKRMEEKLTSLKRRGVMLRMKTRKVEGR